MDRAPFQKVMWVKDWAFWLGDVWLLMVFLGQMMALKLESLKADMKGSTKGFETANVMAEQKAMMSVEMRGLLMGKWME